MFKSLACVPPDPTFQLLQQFRDDPREKKVNLGIGLYFDPDGSPFVFDTIKKAVAELDVSNFNYLPIGGEREFLDLAAEWFLGDEYDRGRVAMQATCGGTQACRCFADLAMEVLHEKEIQIATPTWVNYWALFKQMKIKTFDHCDGDCSVNYEGYLRAAKEAPDGSAFLIQGGLAHNPTGVNLSLEQLGNLIDVLEEKKMILYMDMAYCGLGESLDADREFVRKCWRDLERFAVGVSFSKNASLYEHRCGALFIKTVNGACVESQLKKSIRETISMPPGFGQELMSRVLSEYREEWEAELEGVREDVMARREALVGRLGEGFECLGKTRGMFGLLPLSQEQVLKLREEFGIYVLDNGRVNFAGLRMADLDYIVEGIEGVA